MPPPMTAAVTFATAIPSRYISVTRRPELRAEIGQHRQRAVSARRAEDAAARPGARPAEIEPLHRRLVARPAGYRSEGEHLIRRNLAMEDVAAGDADVLFDVRRSENLHVLDGVPDVRRVLGEGVDDVLADLVATAGPITFGQIVGSVLHEEGHRVFPLRSQPIFGRALNVAVHEWSSRWLPKLSIVGRPFQVVDRGIDDDAAGVLRTNLRSRHRREVGQLAQPQQHFDDRAFDLHLLESG